MTRVQKRTASLLAGFITSATVGDVCVRNSLKMVSELSPQFPCSHESDRLIRTAVEELLARSGTPDDIKQLVYAAQRALNVSAFKPAEARDGSEDGKGAAEEGEVQEGGGGGDGGGAGGVGAPRGRGANMAPVDAVGHKRARDYGGGGGGGGGGGDAGRRGPAGGRSGHRGASGR